jgi:hypothetical protein
MGGACSPHERNKNACNILVGNLKGRDHLEDIGIDGNIILRGILGE